MNDFSEITEKITRIQSNYDPRERALRISMFNKVGGDLSKFNPCATAANCGANAICVVEEDDTHSVSFYIFSFIQRPKSFIFTIFYYFSANVKTDLQQRPQQMMVLNTV